MKHLVITFSLFFSLQAWGQDVNNETSSLTPFIQALHHFSKNVPQEKVYLHFDNTSYYQGDHIWFKCYTITSAQHQLSKLSKTLYVELLNPGGEVVDKRVLKIENGQCHGDFMLNQLPFYSGFYEVRAYTKYMLNFDDDIIFSRLLPVFDKPKEEGDFEEKKMLKYGMFGPGGRYPTKRGKPEKGKAVNLRFFPEGGNLVQGIASRLAFEVTDAIGNPIDITGIVVDEKKQELCSFATLHEGRGVFPYTPGADKRKAIVEYSGKKYQFDLPPGLSHGVVMEVDNLAYTDSMGITLRKNSNTPVEILGMVILNGGKLRYYCLANIADDEICFKIGKVQLPSGVSQVVLFNRNGEILCDRLVFTSKGNQLDIKAKTNKPAYQPYELVDMEISVADKEANPVCTTFSLSVRDGANEVDYQHDILTDLLLMSEIKGYVRNPSYYFEDNDNARQAALDLLLMVQGWRRYSWKQMAGVEPFEIKHLPEQGIVTNGKVVILVRQKPKPDVDVLLLLQKRGKEDEEGGNFIESFVTDSLGRFSFVSDIPGKWNMMLSVKEKGKRKDHRILLDRVFSPEPKRYDYAEMQINIAGKKNRGIPDEVMPGQLENEVDLTSVLIAYEDSLAKAGISEKVHHLSEVTIKAKRKTKERDIYKNRSTSVAYYDVPSEYDDIYDNGKYIGDDMHQLLANMNRDFSIRSGGPNEYLLYKNRLPLFIINYERIDLTRGMGYFNYKLIGLHAIKSIYINENISTICQYVVPSPGITCMGLAKEFSCVVFIETYPDGKIPVRGAKGIRKTWLEGYSPVKEFYNPDYSVLPPEPDYRRTLYWNPSVTTDEHGHTKINFYNNSRCKNISISAETITPQGMIGVYKDE